MPPNLPIHVANCSAQSLKAVLKKYYSSLLFKLVCQVQQKKTQYDRFQLILAVLTDSIELRQVFDLYGLKLQPLADDDTDANASSGMSVFTEASKAYYSYVLDRAWAEDIL